jgi:hypothetical protein
MMGWKGVYIICNAQKSNTLAFGDFNRMPITSIIIYTRIAMDAVYHAQIGKYQEYGLLGTTSDSVQHWRA